MGRKSDRHLVISSVGTVSLMVVGLNVLHVSLTSASEEHPHDKDLQASHADHDSAFQQAEVEHSLLCTPDRAEVPVFTCAEVFLLASEG